MRFSRYCNFEFACVAVSAVHVRDSYCGEIVCPQVASKQINSVLVCVRVRLIHLDCSRGHRNFNCSFERRWRAIRLQRERCLHYIIRIYKFKFIFRQNQIFAFTFAVAAVLLVNKTVHKMRSPAESTKLKCVKTNPLDSNASEIVHLFRNN